MESFLIFAGGLGVGAILVAVVLLNRRRTPIGDVLRKFFLCDPNRLVIVTRSFTPVDLPNLHLALSSLVKSARGEATVLGYAAGAAWGQDTGLRAMIREGGIPGLGPIRLAPVIYRELDIDFDSRMQCVENGIHLLDLPEARLAAHVHVSQGFPGAKLELEVMGPTQDDVAQFLDRLRLEMKKANVYRGKVITLDTGTAQALAGVAYEVRFHRLPRIVREDIILPEKTLERLERHTIRFFEKAELLRASGRSLRRGILLHGKPGTGKSYTAKWLAQTLEKVTVILVSGEQLYLIKECCSLARALAPSLVILEDVDLIAGDRKDLPLVPQATLHQLLNEMDGVAPDAEVLFLLTTNLPDLLEPALAQRPGRVDLAIEYPLPDAAGRRRLLSLYGRGLDLHMELPEHWVSRSEGASPAFVQEWLRLAALFAAEDQSLNDGKIRVADRHLDQALCDLVLSEHHLTRKLLGFSGEERL
jgi:AAA+ superfamily predicted ATPase